MSLGALIPVAAMPRTLLTDHGLVDQDVVPRLHKQGPLLVSSKREVGAERARGQENIALPEERQLMKPTMNPYYSI